ncbi:MAG TPA: SDR family oxidoreductase [Pirellulales bacterium]|jgi:nucleoside-diphosphate-sugar epimerase
MAEIPQERLRDTLRPGAMPPLPSSVPVSRESERASLETKLIVGCGYLGLRVAERWLDAGHEVFAVTRSRERAAGFAKRGLRPIVADVMRLDSLVGLPAASSILYAVGYDRKQSFGIEEVYLRGLVNVLNALPTNAGRVVYVSSTGVYGDCGGAWIDEHTPCFPERAGGRACLAAEEALLSHPRGANAVVLRMAGIYGPGRIPNREALQQGRTIPAPAAGWLNLIHVDDAASVVLAAEKVARGPRYYLVSDGRPVARRDYYRQLAQLLEAPPPRFIAPDATLPSAVRAASDKRVSNSRLRNELGVHFAFPSFREGLAGIVATG